MILWESILKVIHKLITQGTKAQVRVGKVKEVLEASILEISDKALTMVLEDITSKIKIKKEHFMSSNKDRDKEPRKWEDRDSINMNKLKEKLIKITRIFKEDNTITIKIKMVRNTMSLEGHQKNSLISFSKTSRRISINKQGGVKINTMKKTFFNKIKNSKNIDKKLHLNNGLNNNKEINSSIQ